VTQATGAVARAGVPPRSVFGSPGSRRGAEVVRAYALFLPAALLVFGVLAYPLGWEVAVSLTDASVRHPAGTFIGVQNYVSLLADPDTWRMVGTTLVYLATTTVLKLAVGMAIALLLAAPGPGRGLGALAAFLPWAYPAGLSLVGWYWFMLPPLHSSFSEVMATLRWWVDGWAGEGTWRFATLVVFNVWRGGSFVGIFLLAALTGIPQDLFDYAALEVGPGWRKVWKVTVPLLRPFLALAAFLSLVGAVADLEHAWMQSGLRIVYPVVWMEAAHLALIGGQWAKAAALSLLLVPLLVVVLFACYRVFEPLEEDPL
jgi:multiple sugar transport system permease protein